MNNGVVLFMTHYLSLKVVSEFQSMCCQLAGQFDVVLLYDDTNGTFDRNMLSKDAKYYLFYEKNIEYFSYPVKNYLHPGKIFPMDVDYVFLDYFRNYPDYEYYWIAEYDVKYTGNWNVFFNNFAHSTSDLLATNIHRFSAFPEWPMWKTLRIPCDMNVSKANWIRAFFPFCRFSSQALQSINLAYQQGWAGHYEVSIGTLLLNAGLVLEDFGGQGEFVKKGNENKYYTSTINNKFLSPGTFVYRPLKYKAGNITDMLWHPVKELDILGYLKKIFTLLFWKQRYWDWLAKRY